MSEEPESASAAALPQNEAAAPPNAAWLRLWNMHFVEFVYACIYFVADGLMCQRNLRVHLQLHYLRMKLQHHQMQLGYGCRICIL